MREPLAQLVDRKLGRRRILITGHSGFVGSWLSLWLHRSGAELVGCSLARPIDIGPMPQIDGIVESHELDVRDAGSLERLVAQTQPEVIFHLAAQPLVIASLSDPLGTLLSNVMGTAHLLEAARKVSTVRAVVVVTSDKCYATSRQPHVEGDPLGGDDPYSASKAAAEMVAHAYRHSYFAQLGIGVATARAGNILGGGDWATDRLIPDCARALQSGVPVILRHPDAIRPWQHVLDAVSGYVQLAAALLDDPTQFAAPWNFGPPPEASLTVGKVVGMLVEKWQAAGTSFPDPITDTDRHVPERDRLELVSDRATTALGWSQLLSADEVIDWTADWYRLAIHGQSDPTELTTSQISQYLDKSVEALAPSHL